MSKLTFGKFHALNQAPFSDIFLHLPKGNYQEVGPGGSTEIPGMDFIYLGGIRGWVNHGAIHNIWNSDFWTGNPVILPLASKSPEGTSMLKINDWGLKWLLK